MSSNSSEIETNYAFSDGLVNFGGNGGFWSPDALFNGMEFMRQQKEFQQNFFTDYDSVVNQRESTQFGLKDSIVFQLN